MVEIIKYLNIECRTCLKPDNGWKSLNSMTRDYKRRIKMYGELLEEVTNISPYDNKYPELPEFLCGNCSRRLKFAHKFITLAKEVNAKYYSILEEQIDLETAMEIKFEDIEQEVKFEQLSVTEIKDESGLEVKNENNNINIDCLQQTETYNEEILTESNQEQQNEIDNIVVRESNSDLENPIPDEEIEKIFTNNNVDEDFDCNIEYLPLEDEESDSWKPSTNQSTKNINKRKGSTETETNDGDVAVRCKTCNNIFLNSKALAEHLKNSHIPDEKKIICRLCGLKFSRYGNLHVHMRSRHGPETVTYIRPPKPESDYIYQCDQCSKKYCRKFNLVHHKKLKHSATAAKQQTSKEKSHEKALLCPICGNVFSTKINLTAHIRAHTGERPFKCEFCDRAFYLPSQRNRHRRQHTGDKPHICIICEKAFAAPKDLRQHMLTHSDVRAHKCSLCERRYKTAHDLNTHFRTHSGERPFVCNVCGDTFNRPNSLRAHRKIHERSKIADDESQ